MNDFLGSFVPNPDRDRWQTGKKDNTTWEVVKIAIFITPIFLSAFYLLLQ